MSGGPTGPVSSRWRRITRRDKRDVLTAIAVLAIAILLVMTSVVTNSGILSDSFGSGTVADSTPVDTRLYSDPDLLAIPAAREDPRFEPIAQTPQAKWFSDWSTSETVRSDIGDYLAGAQAANAVPTIVLYRIPQLDCGSRIAPDEQAYKGARDEQAYKDWVDGAVDALMGHGDAIVVLEPDALPHLGQCEHGDRSGMLRYAVDALSNTGARIYIDAGHGNWLNAAETADRLKELDVDKVEGFSLNVSNYNTTEREVQYAESVRSELSKLGVTDSHYIIDIGRNGAGSQDHYCNAPGARLGDAPQLFHGAALDGLLWVKNPGETDGLCEGGPMIGFWPKGALRLLGLEEAHATGDRNSTEWIAVLVLGGVAAATVLGFAFFRRRRNAGNQRGVNTQQQPVGNPD